MQIKSLGVGSMFAAGLLLIGGCVNARTAAGPASVGVHQVIEGTTIHGGKSFARSRDTYLDIRRAASPTITNTPAPHPGEYGTRVVFGPDPSLASPPAINAILVQESVTDSSGLTEELAVLDLSDGYAAVWGWRPRVRMRHIIAGSDGTTLIVQFRPGVAPVERVYVLDKPSTTPVYVYRKSNPSQVIKSWPDNDSYVDFTGSSATPGPVVLLSSDPAARAWVNLVRPKMK